MKRSTIEAIQETLRTRHPDNAVAVPGTDPAISFGELREMAACALKSATPSAPSPDATKRARAWIAERRKALYAYLEAAVAGPVDPKLLNEQEEASLAAELERYAADVGAEREANHGDLSKTVGWFLDKFPVTDETLSAEMVGALVALRAVHAACAIEPSERRHIEQEVFEEIAVERERAAERRGRVLGAEECRDRFRRDSGMPSVAQAQCEAVAARYRQPAGVDTDAILEADDGDVDSSTRAGLGTEADRD